MAGSDYCWQHDASNSDKAKQSKSFDVDRISPDSGSTGVESTMIMTHGGVGGAESIKIQNIYPSYQPRRTVTKVQRFLSWTKLLSMASETAIAIGAASAEPYYVPFVVMAILTKARKQFSIELTETEASVVWALWSENSTLHYIREGKIRRVVNRERKKYGLAPVSKSDLREALVVLQNMGSVKKKFNRWCLIESVKIN